MHVSLVQKIVSNFILQSLKISKLRNFQTKKVFQLHKDKVCWSEAILCFWSSNQMTVKSNKISELNQSLAMQTVENTPLQHSTARKKNLKKGSLRTWYVLLCSFGEVFHPYNYTSELAPTLPHHGPE